MTLALRRRTTSGTVATRRSIALETRQVETLQETIDRLRLQVEDLHASRRRLVVAADAERRDIERELHQGMQQHLLALAGNLQLATQLADRDPAAAKTHLEELRRDVQHALDEASKLAERIYPALLSARGLAAALRSAAARADIRASVEVTLAGEPPGLAAAVYLCCLEALARAGAGSEATVAVRNQDGALAFEVLVDGEHWDAEMELPLRDRVEALGGRLTIRSEPGRHTHVSGSFPSPR